MKARYLSVAIILMGLAIFFGYWVGLSKCRKIATVSFPNHAIQAAAGESRK